MDNQAVIERIMKNLSFQLQPGSLKQTNHDAPTNIDPLNIKITVRKNEANDSSSQGFISNNQSEPEMVRQKVKLVSSKETIMTFDIFMEKNYQQKNSRKLYKNFFDKLKPGLCMKPTGDNDEIYMPVSGHSIHEKEKLSKNKLEVISKTYKPRNEKSFLGFKCKPGGCLDPPFDEDTYSDDPNVLIQDILENNPKKSISKSQQLPVLIKPDKKTAEITINANLDKKVSPKGSLVTYPPDNDEKKNTHKSRILERDKTMYKGCIEDHLRKSVNDSKNSFFSLPKETKRDSSNNFGQDSLKVIYKNVKDDVIIQPGSIKQSNHDTSTNIDPLNNKITVRNNEENESISRGLISNNQSQPERVRQKLRHVNSEETLGLLMEKEYQQKSAELYKNLFDKLKPDGFDDPFDEHTYSHQPSVQDLSEDNPKPQQLPVFIKLDEKPAGNRSNTNLAKNTPLKDSFMTYPLDEGENNNRRPQVSEGNKTINGHCEEDILEKSVNGSMNNYPKKNTCISLNLPLFIKYDMKTTENGTTQLDKKASRKGSLITYQLDGDKNNNLMSQVSQRDKIINTGLKEDKFKKSVVDSKNNYPKKSTSESQNFLMKSYEKTVENSLYTNLDKKASPKDSLITYPLDDDENNIRSSRMLEKDKAKNSFFIEDQLTKSVNDSKNSFFSRPKGIKGDSSNNFRQNSLKVICKNDMKIDNMHLNKEVHKPIDSSNIKSCSDVNLYNTQSTNKYLITEEKNNLPCTEATSLNDSVFHSKPLNEDSISQGGNAFVKSPTLENDLIHYLQRDLNTVITDNISVDIISDVKCHVSISKNYSSVSLASRTFNESDNKISHDIHLYKIESPKHSVIISLPDDSNKRDSVVISKIKKDKEVLISNLSNEGQLNLSVKKVNSLETRNEGGKTKPSEDLVFVGQIQLTELISISSAPVLDTSLLEIESSNTAKIKFSCSDIVVTNPETLTSVQSNAQPLTIPDKRIGDFETKLNQNVWQSTEDETSYTNLQRKDLSKIVDCDLYEPIIKTKTFNIANMYQNDDSLIKVDNEIELSYKSDKNVYDTQTNKNRKINDTTVDVIRQCEIISRNDFQTTYNLQNPTELVDRDTIMYGSHNTPNDADYVRRSMINNGNDVSNDVDSHVIIECNHYVKLDTITNDINKQHNCVRNSLQNSKEDVKIENREFSYPKNHDDINLEIKEHLRDQFIDKEIIESDNVDNDIVRSFDKVELITKAHFVSDSCTLYPSSKRSLAETALWKQPKIITDNYNIKLKSKEPCRNERPGIEKILAPADVLSTIIEANNIIILDLSFESYLNNRNQRIIRTVNYDTDIKEHENEQTIFIKSQIKLPLNDNHHEISIPLDSNLDMIIKIKKGNDNKKIGTNKAAIATNQSKSPDQKEYYGTNKKIDRTLTDLYEHDLIPLQKTIRSIKLEIDALAKQEKDLIAKKRTLCINQPINPKTRCSNKTVCRNF